MIRIDTSRLLVSERVRVTHPRRAAWEISRDTVGAIEAGRAGEIDLPQLALVGEDGEHAPERDGQVMAS